VNIVVFALTKIEIVDIQNFYYNFSTHYRYGRNRTKDKLFNIYIKKEVCL
jgi:hypothetical protein